MAILAGAAGSAAGRPNVLVILTDDQGVGDLSSSGNPDLKTPRLDRLRQEGMDFGRMIGAPTGAGTRAQLLSGMHEFRCGVSHTLAGRNLIRPGVVLLPEWLRKAGYRTAIIGRWGLGEAFPCRPEDRGFDDFWVCGGGGLGQTSDRWGNGTFNPQVRTREGWQARQGHATRVWAAEATRYLAARVADQQPFFLLLAFTAPHAPYEAAPGSAGRFVKAGLKEPVASFYAMIEDLDTGVGEVLDELERLQLADSTIVVFMGDNGSALGAWPCGLKGVKGSPDEGGVRIPAAIRWPGHIAPNQRTDELAGAFDVFETLVGFCDLPVPGDPQRDGRDFSHLLLGTGGAPPVGMIFTHLGGWSGDDRPERHRSTGFAVREGTWLLSGLDLFDLATDPGQRVNLFEQRPELATRLLAGYGTWWNAILPNVREPVRYAVGDPRQPVLRLDASGWWPSREVGGAAGADGLATQVAVRRVLESLTAGNPVPETAGVWKLMVVREGHYRITLSMIPGEAPQAEIDRIGQLKAGMLHIRTGKQELQMQVVKGATAVTVRMDLSAGALDLEAWFAGQLPDARILGALFAEIERVGDRKRPELDFDFHTVPKK